MAFLDNLYSDATSGGGGIYGSDNSDLLRRKPITEAGNQLAPFFYNRLDAERNDPVLNAQQRDSLGLNAGRLRTTMDPSQMNTVYKPPASESSDQLTPYQAGELNLGQQKLASDTKTGNEKLALEQSKHELDTLKNAQINASETKKYQDAADLANRKLQLAQEAQAGKEYDATRTAAYNDARVNALQAQHDLENHQKDSAAAEAKRVNDQRIAEMQARIDALNNPKSTTETVTTPEGTSTKVTSKSSANSPKGKRVIAPNGKGGIWNTDDPLPAGYKLEGQ